MLLGACAENPDTPPPEPPPPHAASAAGEALTTDRPRYIMEEGPFAPETTITSTFTAPSDTTVYIVNCNGAFSPGLQLLQDGQWIDVWAAEINQCLSPPIVISAGGTRTTTMTVESGAEARVDSRKTDRRIGGGTYRAVWYGLYTSYDEKTWPFGKELPLEKRVSAPFEIEKAAPHDPSRPSAPQPPREITHAEPASGGRVDALSPLRVRFDFSAWPDGPAGIPQLYVDRRYVSERATSKGTEKKPELEFIPRGGWSSGPHEVRVIYMDRDGRYHWYAWSFTVTS